MDSLFVYMFNVWVYESINNNETKRSNFVIWNTSIDQNHWNRLRIMYAVACSNDNNSKCSLDIANVSIFAVNQMDKFHEEKLFV